MEVSPPSLAPAARILVVEDADGLREMVVLLLEGRGHTVTGCEDADQAFRALAHSPFDIVVTDLMLGPTSGLDLITRIRGDLPPPVPPIVACSGFRDFETEALRRGDAVFVPKPFESDSLVGTIEGLLASQPMGAREREQAEEATRLLRAQAVEAARRTLARLAPHADVFRRRAQLTAGFLPRYLGFGQCFVLLLRGHELQIGASSHPEIWPRGQPCELSICRDLLETGSALIMPDLARVGAMVRAPDGRPLRFFAGVPFLADQVPVGALCLVDPTPHPFGADGLGLLEALGQRATALLSVKGTTLPPLWTVSGLLSREALHQLLTVELGRMHREPVSVSVFVFAGATAALPPGPRSAAAELGGGRFVAFRAQYRVEGEPELHRFVADTAGREGFRGGGLVTVESGAGVMVDAVGLLRSAERLLDSVLAAVPGTVEQIVIRRQPVVMHQQP